MIKLIDIDLKDQNEIDIAMEVLYAVSRKNGVPSKYCLSEEFFNLESEYKEEKGKLLHRIEELNNEIREKDATIDSLTEQLGKYVVISTPQRNVSVSHFMVSHDKLEETTSHDATYVARSITNSGEYEFNYNEEKAQHNRVIRHKETELNPFCEIVYEDNNSNYVENKGKGVFISNSDGFKVINKAKVSLIRR